MTTAGIDFRDLAPGFADPVLESQRSFRLVLQAMAEPGRRVPLAPDLDPPAPLLPTTAAVALALVDYDTPVWLGGAAHGVADWLRFHTGCPVVDDPGHAAFAIALGDWPALDALAAGTDAYPDRSATLIAQVETLSASGLHLTGPGIDGARDFGVAPMPDDFLAAWKANTKLFPRGVDLILCDGNQVAALPRTCTVGQAE
ncbi:MAG: phosphonate C-P lyase system protein PhnH [Alphaproteobacteria bacterium]